MVIQRYFLSGLILIFLSACQSAPSKPSLFEELGGMSGIEQIAGNFITEIGYDQVIIDHFKETNLERFHEQLSLHLCEISGGPCQYDGDDMVTVHQGMNINENEFNQTVELLINAMNKSEIPHRTQNKLLSKLAPMREDIIYQ